MVGLVQGGDKLEGGGREGGGARFREPRVQWAEGAGARLREAGLVNAIGPHMPPEAGKTARRLRWMGRLQPVYPSSLSTHHSSLTTNLLNCRRRWLWPRTTPACGTTVT